MPFSPECGDRIDLFRDYEILSRVHEESRTLTDLFRMDDGQHGASAPDPQGDRPDHAKGTLVRIAFFRDAASTLRSSRRFQDRADGVRKPALLAEIERAEAELKRLPPWCRTWTEPAKPGVLPMCMDGTWPDWVGPYVTDLADGISVSPPAMTELWTFLFDEKSWLQRCIHGWARRWCRAERRDNESAGVSDVVQETNRQLHLLILRSAGKWANRNLQGDFYSWEGLVTMHARKTVERASLKHFGIPNSVEGRKNVRKTRSLSDEELKQLQVLDAGMSFQEMFQKRFARLNFEEKEIVKLKMERLSIKKKIADALSIKEHAVKARLKSAFKKLRGNEWTE